MIDEKTAVMRVAPKQLDEILHPILDPESEKKAQVIAKGCLQVRWSGWQTCLYFRSCTEAAARGEEAILVREETNPEDVEGMRVSVGLLTSRGGMTSHAALVARGWGKCCIVGCDAIKFATVDGQRVINIGDKSYKEGDISLSMVRRGMYMM